jgi:GT2 family glycosyltransferase
VKITVYVPCHNNERTVAEVLRGITSQVRPADQVMLIDDHCTDRSPAIARELGVGVIELTDHHGLAAGRNCALQNATGEIILGVDADVVLDKQYLLELERRFDAQAEIAAIGGRLDEKFTDTPADLWRAVHMPQHYGDSEKINPRLLFGATMACRVAPVKEIGGWDEKFKTNHEDLDLSTRLKAGGFKLLYLPACRAAHLRRDTPETVLRGIWNWNRYSFEGNLDTVPMWIAKALPTIWAIYRGFRVVDLQFAALAPITLSMPWEWIVRDLHAMRAAGVETGEIRELIPMARAVLEQYGCGSVLAANLCGRLDRLIAELEDRRAGRGRLSPDIISAVRWMALESIPDGNYWRKCDSKAGA